VRISTNVRLFAADGDRDGSRAIGTRVSRAVRDAVLARGTTWLDRAFVVNDWYVSGYQPLIDGRGERVGMLYVGYLERPFRLLKYGVLAGLGGIFFAVMLTAAWVSLRWARRIFGPLERMTATMQRVEHGELDARVGPLTGRDEIGALAGHLDELLDAIDEHTRELDHKVAERTRELSESNEALRAAQQQLVKSEKLAAIGQLTASIAHEVNNPIAVIQGNLDLVRELLGAAAEGVKPELKLIDAQVERMRLIVTRLLQFARPTEYAGYVDAVDVHEVIEDSLVLAGHLLTKTRVQVLRELHATHRPAINRQELQQVLINLIVNAAQAMPDGGRLTIATRDRGDAAGVLIELADTGPGLSAEVMERLFQPFVTHKAEGTGLGLWISRSLVERYGGDITARNADGGGAVFTVWLREEATEGHAVAA
jgi:C4-dicarboxylate-specific signal transduction histidine kinase